ncbi:winged helix-turn-helix domain-containing protein [Solwaraspora sp. WMMD1047]|nr:winged helix-turn-helix domain-containing protein [Solwaraspora sp. WMMD1047]MDG4828392.1 winged helix-turn-helix domain-containing protein [Solwaraspora sp. WMMD1047]
MVNPYSPTPLYVQVADLIAERIASGELAPETLIPSESRIQQEYGVARGTARRAVAQLVDRGLVVTIPQRGTYVRPQS